VLKFDVEGAEWECVPASKSASLKRCRIIVAELHGLVNLHNPTLFRKAQETLKLLSLHHTVTHIHPNNCCPVALVEGVPLPAVLEVTWLRKDRSRFELANDPIPSPLDAPNVPANPEIVLTPWHPGRSRPPAV